MQRGYIRVSTRGQAAGSSPEEQRSALLAAGCGEIYEDIWSGATMERPGFQRLCEDLMPGDSVVVTSMDRFARNETEAYELVLGWVRAGVSVRILNLGTIEDTEMGRLILHIMLSFAEFERDMIRCRTQAGKASRRASDPGYREGRPRKYTAAQLDHAMELLERHSYTQVAQMTGMSRSTVVREARRRGYRKVGWN